MRQFVDWKWACLIALVAALVPQVVGAGVQRTSVVITDDWPIDSMIDPGTLACPGGEIEWLDPLIPVCPGSGRLHLRNLVAYGCLEATAGGAPEPRMSGVAVFEMNGNLKADYSGRVWGTWMLAPSEACDPADLVDPSESWQGTWQGRRTAYCSDGDCYWIGHIFFVGRGNGGELDGLHFKGMEAATTYTPLPLPYELIGICPDPTAPCPPEGMIWGRLRE